MMRLFVGLLVTETAADHFNLPELCREHGNDAPEWCLSALGGCPEHWIPRLGLGECAAQVCQNDQSLRPNPVFLKPVETGTEVCASAADRIEMDLFSGLIGFNFVNLGVEVQDMNALWPLAFEDRADLSLKETQQPAIH